MIKRTPICDACKEEIKEPKWNHYTVKIGYQSIENDSNTDAVLIRDVCNDCHRKIMEIFNK